MSPNKEDMLATKLHTLETEFKADKQLAIAKEKMNDLRFQNIEDSGKRLEKMVMDINDAQKTTASVMLAMSQQITQIYEIFNFDGSKASMNTNRRIWEKVGGRVQRTDTFNDAGWKTFSNWFWKAALIVMVAGVGYLAADNRNTLQTIKEKAGG